MSSLTDRLSNLKEKAQEQIREATVSAEALRISPDDERQVRELADAGDYDAKALLADIETARKAAEGSKPAQAIKAALELMTKIANDDRLRVSVVVREAIESGALRESEEYGPDSVSVYDLGLGRVVRGTAAFGLSETKSLVERLREYVADQREALALALKDGKIQTQLAAEVAVELRMGRVRPWSFIEAKKAEAVKAEAEGGKKRGWPPYFRFTYKVAKEDGTIEAHDSAFISWEREWPGFKPPYSNEKSFEFVGLLHTEAKRQQELLRERLPEFTLDEAEAKESGSFSEILAGGVGEAVLKLEVTWKYQDGREQPIFVKVVRATDKESVKFTKAWPVEAARSLFRRFDGQLKTSLLVYKFVRDEQNRVAELSFEDIRDSRLREACQNRLAREAQMEMIAASRVKHDEANREKLQEFRVAIIAKATITKGEFLKGAVGVVAICCDKWQVAPGKEIDLVDGLLQQDEDGNVAVIEVSPATAKLVFGGKPPAPDQTMSRRQIGAVDKRVWAWIMRANDTPAGAAANSAQEAKQEEEKHQPFRKPNTAYEVAMQEAKPKTPRGQRSKDRRGKGRPEPQDELEG